MTALAFAFTAELWEHEGMSGSWHFVALPEGVSDEIEARTTPGAGFGSVRVEVTVGSTTWRTSVFPDKKRATYVLPVKAAVRRSEGLHAGASTDLRLQVVE